MQITHFYLSMFLYCLTVAICKNIWFWFFLIQVQRAEDSHPLEFLFWWKCALQISPSSLQRKSATSIGLGFLSPPHLRKPITTVEIVKLCCSVSKPAEGAAVEQHRPPLQCCRSAGTWNHLPQKIIQTQVGWDGRKKCYLPPTKEQGHWERCHYSMANKAISVIIALKQANKKQNQTKQQLKLSSDLIFYSRLIEIAICSV